MMEDEKTVQLYCDIDDGGNIIRSFMGENIIPSKSFDFFDMIDAETADNIEKYKVGVEGIKSTLILK